jgi:hypothetical protein
MVWWALVGMCMFVLTDLYLHIRHNKKQEHTSLVVDRVQKKIFDVLESSG